MIDGDSRELVNVLIAIRDSIDELKPKENNMKNIYRLRDGFLHQLKAKTSWGRNQLTEIFLSLIKNIEEDI